MPDKEKIPYANIEDVSDILNSVGKDFLDLRSNTGYQGASGRKVKLTRSTLEKTLNVYQNAGLDENHPMTNALMIMLSSDMWQSTTRVSSDYKGETKYPTISKLGTINLRVGGNKNGTGGFFQDLKTGDSVKASYSKDGKTITITRT